MTLFARWVIVQLGKIVHVAAALIAKTRHTANCPIREGATANR
jgi:hypothetical protein